MLPLFEKVTPNILGNVGVTFAKSGGRIIINTDGARLPKRRIRSPQRSQGRERWRAKKVKDESEKSGGARFCNR